MKRTTYGALKAYGMQLHLKAKNKLTHANEVHKVSNLLR